MRVYAADDIYDFYDPDAIRLIPMFLWDGMTRTELRIACARLMKAAMAEKERRVDYSGLHVEARRRD